MRWLVLVCIMLSGCSIKPVSTLHTYKDLQVKLSQADKSWYRLVDEKRRLVSKSTGVNGVLNFGISGRTDVSQCFYVINKKGENIFGGTSRISLSLIAEYRKINAEKQALERKRDRNERADKRYRSKYKSDWKSLRANRAFKNKTCHTPAQGPIPRKPVTKCATEKQCREEGGAICFSQFLGSEGCGIALKKLKIPGLLSSPGCAAAAAELANQKYNMDDALVDLLHGVVDDVADSLIESNSGWDQFWGVVAKGLSYGVKLNKAQECTNAFVNRYYGPKHRWLNEVKRIQNEPRLTKNRCVALINQVNDYHKKINDNVNKLKKSSKELSEINLKHQQLLKVKKPVSFCG